MPELITLNSIKNKIDVNKLRYVFDETVRFENNHVSLLRMTFYNFFS